MTKLPQGPLTCANHTPPWFVGHWRDWHRGHGCDRDDGQPRSEEARAEVAQHAANEASGFLTDAELRFLRASTTAGNALLVRALDELAARRRVTKSDNVEPQRRCARGAHLGPVRLRHDRLHGAPLEVWICERCGKDITDEYNSHTGFYEQQRAAERMRAAVFDHSTLTTKHFEPLLGQPCVCEHCERLPFHEDP